MLTSDMNDRLTQVGPGTPMGELMRRYWHPIAASLELNEENPTKEIRLLGEDLVLYRDASGKVGCIEPSCAHRKANLSYGIPEENGIRCAYHGWIFNETGQCMDQPSEPEGSKFKDKVRIKAYPVEEKGGVIHIYMGPQPVPVLPNWDLYQWEGVERSTYAVMLPCNWLQCHENSLDPVHFQWLHRYYGMWRASKVMGEERYDEFDRISAARGKAHVKIGFDRFEYGVIKRRILEGEDEQSEWWRIGHPILFPYTLRVGQGTWFEFQHRVPVDDTHTLHFGYTIRTPEPGEVIEPGPMTHENRPAFFDNGRIKDDWVVGQDQLAWIIQGPRMDRSTEALGVTDVGLIMFRNMLNEQIKVVEDGGDPVNVHRTQKDIIELPTEYAWFPGYDRTGGPFADMQPAPVELERSLE